MGEGLTSIEPHAGDPHDGELHRDHVALPARRVITRRLVQGYYLAVGKDPGVEARRLLGVVVVPEADGVPGSHGLAP
ncbi:hypothetical protein D3C80_1695270 [compost metagenome]